MPTRVLVVQPLLRPPGGGNGLVAWTLQALQADHDVDLLTWEPVDFEAVNRYFGTAIDPAGVRLHLAPHWLRALLPEGWTLLKHNVLLRQCKQLRGSYEVVLCGHNESDFGARGIQYVHYPCFDDPRVNDASKRVPEFSDLAWRHRSHAMMRAYFALCARVSGFTMEGVRRNVTLVNSNWTGRLVKEILAIEPRTVYPPVHAEFPIVPWQERELGFVCVGRIAPEKRIDRIIRILSGVRRRGWDVHLHVIGNRTDHPSYFARIEPLLQESRSWVFLEENLPHAELRALVARHRYGIHAMDREHFGIAVAEMVKAGCIVFTPNDGGQVEIVGNDARLTYDGDEEAVEKITTVLGEPGLQRGLLEHLADCAGRFGAARFIGEIRSIVGEFAGRSGGA